MSNTKHEGKTPEAGERTQPSELAELAEARSELYYVKAQRDELLAACKAQHTAIDILLAMLIERDHSFMPTKSQAWPLMIAGNAAIARAEAGAK